MFIDGNLATDIPETAYDVLVIGGGPAGITLTHELRGRGLRIALLESGGLDFSSDVQLLNDGVVEGNKEFDLLAGRLRFFGGTSNHWGGHCTPLDPVDFDRAPASGLTGWPITRRDLELFYERAHDYCDLGTYRYDYRAFMRPSRNDLLMPDNPDLQTAILRQSPPTKFGEKYAAILGDSEDVHVWLNTNAVSLDIAADGDVRSVRTRTLGGPERSFTTRVVVLACGTVEATRLLLYSNALSGARFGNASDLLGRCYMDHPSGGAAFLYFSEPVREKLYWADIKEHTDNGIPLHFVLRPTDEFLLRTGLPNSHYFLIPFKTDDSDRQRRAEASSSLRSLKRIKKWVSGGGPDEFQLSRHYCNFITKADSFLAEQAIKLAGGDTVEQVLLKYESEQLPTRSNYVALGPDRDALGVPRPVVRWAPTQDDIDAVIETATRVGRFVGEVGLGRLQLEDHSDHPYWGMTTAWHQLGTMRMATTENFGVVDTDCRVFGTSALYVASGAVMPTIGRANPTLTIVALSIRLADHLAERLLA